MIIYHRPADLDHHLQHLRTSGQSMGFVPTMGALHEGHLSLIEVAQHENDLVVCSVFVNPTQFNDPSDFDKYPRELSTDAEKLVDIGCDLLFAPSEADIYPHKNHQSEVYDLGGLDERLEGAYRPGHFQGVAQVVSRFMDIVEPNSLYLGQKDYQQFRILHYLITQVQQRKAKVIACPIMREANGLAMSSRNVLLTDTEREAAVLLSECLRQTLQEAHQHTPPAIREAMEEKLLSEPLIRELDYFEIVNAETLEPVSRWSEADTILALVAAKFPSARLIDNTLVKENGQFRTSL